MITTYWIDLGQPGLIRQIQDPNYETMKTP